jgi:glycosyltransferase involved in cell wall biosynthesis
MVAHLVPWKEHGLFIEAAATVAPEYPSVRFAVVGDDRFGDHPAYRTELEQRAEALGLRNRLFFAGYRRDMDAVMRDLDLLVHPASREPFGRVLLEAMRAGKPVVAADGGGPRDIIENGVSGVLVPPGDPGALARAVGGLIRDRAQASRLAAAGRARARQAFDIRQTVSRTESLYREVLAARESRH